MNLPFVAGALLGILGSLLLNIGKGIQKQKVHVFLHGRRMFAPEHRQDLKIWLLGFGMTSCNFLPVALGIWLSGSPSIISAMTGVGLIGLVAYAVKAIGERIGPSDCAGIVMVVIATSALGYLGSGASAIHDDFPDAAVVRVVLPLLGALALACVVALRWRRIHGVTFGLTAGVSIGLGMFLEHVALVRAGGSFIDQIWYPYPYIAMLAGTMGMVVTQFGFLRGRALEVVPALNSSIILTPIFLEAAVYDHFPAPLSSVFIAMIVSGVVLLSAGAAARAQTAMKTIPAAASPGVEPG